MNSKQRYATIKPVLELLVEEAYTGAYAIFVNADRPDEYVQAVWTGTELMGEVGSREWVDPVKPLSPAGREALDALGFSGGGAERNYVRPSLPQPVGRAAALLNHAFKVAYHGRGAELVVKTNSVAIEAWLRAKGTFVSDPVAVVPAEPVNEDMVRAALDARGWRIFHDETSGAVMTFWGWDPFLGQGVHVFYAISGDAPWRVLSINAIGDRPVFDGDRACVLEWINAWNDEHRWPSVSLSRQQGQEFSWIHCCWSMPARVAMAPPVVADAVDAVTNAALEFFRFLQGKRTGRGQPASTGR